MSYKEQMLQQKRQELSEREATLTTQTVLERYEAMKADGQLASPSSLKLALQDDAYGLVAEFKRKSPECRSGATSALSWFRRRRRSCRFYANK